MGVRRRGAERASARVHCLALSFRGGRRAREAGIRRKRKGEINPPLAISPMALPCCFCARKATGICRSVAPALATALDPCLHSSGFRARDGLRSALPFPSLSIGFMSD